MCVATNTTAAGRNASTSSTPFHGPPFTRRKSPSPISCAIPIASTAASTATGGAPSEHPVRRLEHPGEPHAAVRPRRHSPPVNRLAVRPEVARREVGAPFGPERTVQCRTDLFPGHARARERPDDVPIGRPHADGQRCDGRREVPYLRLEPHAIPD